MSGEVLGDGGRVPFKAVLSAARGGLGLGSEPADEPIKLMVFKKASSEGEVSCRDQIRLVKSIVDGAVLRGASRGCLTK